MGSALSSVDQSLRIAVEHHQAGRLSEAEVLYRRILAQSPHHPDALHLLGVIAGQTGHLDDAVRLIERAVQVKPDFAEAHSNLGRLLASQGNTTKSVAACKRAAMLRPQDAQLRFALGIALRMNGDRDEAIEAFKSALRLNPALAEAYSELGSLYKGKGRLDEAVAEYRHALALKPDFADARNNLGNTLVDMDRVLEAIQEYTRATELQPRSAVYHANLGDALCRIDRFRDAIVSFNSALSLMPECVQALSGAAVALSGLNRHDEAVDLHERALKFSPDDRAARRAFAETLFAKHDLQSAETVYRSALELSPDDPLLWTGLGSVHRSLGRFEEAESCFRKALEIDPDNVRAHKQLSANGRQPSSPEIERLTVLLARPDLPEEQRIAAGFALAKLLDDDERYDEAFARFAEANSLHRDRRARAGEQFVAGKLHEQINRITEIFTRDFFARRVAWGDPTELPVFVVGMPRSGTTLVEQIMASHSQVFRDGELNAINDLAPKFHYPAGALDWLPERISEAANGHLNLLKQLGGGAKFVIDKLPANIIHLGLIATLFPNARVIFCQREPLDNCLSCYFQLFSSAGLSFVYDLADCAEQYLQQERLKEQWLKVLPSRMMTIQYEELVADLEGQSRRLIDFLNLAWESRCLEFHKTQHPVHTASVWQVRQPIYSSSVGRWKHYEKHLGPLLETLGEAMKAE